MLINDIFRFMDYRKLPYRESTVAVVVNSDLEYLILQKTKYNDNEWDFPGGGVHTRNGESPEDAIKRELVEELGTDAFEVVKKSRFLEKYDWPEDVILRRLKDKGETFRGQVRTQFLATFLGKKGDIVFPQKEIRAIKWVRKNELSKYLIFPNQFTKVQALLEEFEL